MKFVIELLLAELIFLYPAERRDHFRLRVLAVALLCIAGFFLFSENVLDGQTVIRQLVGYLGLFLLTVAAMNLCFKLRFTSLFSLCVAGYAVEHIAFHASKLFDAIVLKRAAVYGTVSAGKLPVNIGAADVGAIDSELLIFPFVYIIMFSTLGLFAARNECWKKADMHFNALSITMVFICVGLTRVAIIYDDSGSVAVSMYAITSCIMALVVQFVLYRLIDLQAENTAVQLLWQEERKQYELSKKTIDTINIKYHDLKHKLKNMDLPREEVESIKDAVRIYGSRIRTGNEVLDVLLTENSLRCSEEGISLTYTGNGADFSFMQTMDIYSLFGNAVSNAMEAVSKLGDPEKKIIDITSERIGDMVNIRICNYFDGDIVMGDALPKTSKKEEEGFHGFGMKSMAIIAEKYGGGLNISTDGDLFILNVYCISSPPAASYTGRAPATAGIFR